MNCFRVLIPAYYLIFACMRCGNKDPDYGRSNVFASGMPKHSAFLVSGTQNLVLNNKLACSLMKIILVSTKWFPISVRIKICYTVNAVPFS